MRYQNKCLVIVRFERMHPLIAFGRQYIMKVILLMDRKTKYPFLIILQYPAIDENGIIRPIFNPQKSPECEF